MDIKQIVNEVYLNKLTDNGGMVWFERERLQEGTIASKRLSFLLIKVS